MAAMSANPVLRHLVSFEMAGMIEHWHFAGDAIHILLRVPTRRCGCNEPHAWFVNRDGRTRCQDCDEKYLAERAALEASRDGARARTGGVTKA